MGHKTQLVTVIQTKKTLQTLVTLKQHNDTIVDTEVDTESIPKFLPPTTFYDTTQFRRL